MGKKAESTIIKVAVPSPSKWTIIVSIAVPIITFNGSPFTERIINETTGSNKPASSMVAKYKTANINRIPVGATCFIPDNDISPNSEKLNPATRPNKTGMSTRAVITDSRLVMIKMRKTAIVAKPKNASMNLVWQIYYFSNFR
jgi:hypothetical protein